MTASVLSPLIPFGYWLYTQKTQKKISIAPQELSISGQKFIFPDWNEKWFSTSYKDMGELYPPFYEKLEFLGLNTRPDLDADEALFRIKGKNEERVVLLGCPFYLGFDAQSHLYFCDPADAVYQVTFDGQELKVFWVGGEKELFVYQYTEKKGGSESFSLRLPKEQFKRWKYLGRDTLLEFLKKEKREAVRLFDPVQQRLYLLTLKDHLYLKEGRLFFEMPKESRGECFLSKLQNVEDTYVSFTLWDQKGFQKELIQIPIEKPIKYGARVQTFLEGAKPFGYEAIWLKNGAKMALYVGDWLIEENGNWDRPTNSKLEEAFEGRLNVALLHFFSMQKEGGKWVVHFEVFDGLHIQKETIRVTLDLKSSLGAAAPLKASSKTEKKEESKEGVRHFPPAIDPMLDDFDDDLEDF